MSSTTTQTVPRLGTRYSDQDIKRGHNEIAAKYGQDPQSMRMSIPMIEKHLDTQPGTKPLVSPSVQPAPVQPAPVKKTGLFGRLLGNASKLAQTAATTAATNAATTALANNMNLTPEEKSKLMECHRIVSSKVSKGGKRKTSKTRRKNRKSKRHNKKRNNKATRKTHKKNILRNIKY